MYLQKTGGNYYIREMQKKEKGKWAAKTLRRLGKITEEEAEKELKIWEENYKPIKYYPILLQGDIMDMLVEVHDNSIDLIIADPPYNVGIKYGTSYYDTKTFIDYIDWCKRWINLSFQKLREGGSFYLVNYPHASAYIQVKILDKLLNYRKTIRWCYESNIGMTNSNFTTASRDILYYTKGANFTFNRDEILIPYVNLGDKRIKELIKKGNKGKAPYDYWFFNLTKNVSKDKITNITNKKNTPPNQLPEKLIERILLVSSNRGDTLLSLFSGSGTDLIVAYKLYRKSIGIELNPDYCDCISERINEKNVSKIPGLDILYKKSYLRD